MKLDQKSWLNLVKERNLALALLIVVLATIYCYLVIGNSILPFIVEHWESSGGDATQHYLGWLAYRYEQWHWPLTYTNRINYPHGTTTVFTDSIPLFAVVFKLFSGLLPEDFQYFGLFILLGFILQYGFGTLLLRYFYQSSWLVPLLGGCFFLISPVMVSRTGGHESLSAHWLILAAIYLYCRALSTKWKKITLPALCSLLFISLGIHFYIAAMVLVISTVVIVQEWWTGLYSITKAAWRLGILLVVFASLLYIWGYLIAHPATVGELWSMNLNSLINSMGRSAYLPGLGFIKPYQWEGFAYLGLGVLLLIPICLFLTVSRQPIKSLFSSRWLPLILALVGLFLFALGNKVYLGEVLLFKINTLPVLSKIQQTVRSTGRFVWPMYYGIVLWIITSLSRLRSQLLVSALLSFSLIIQFADISQPVKAFRDSHSEKKRSILAAEYVEEIKSVKDRTNSKYLWVYPHSSCVGGTDYKDRSIQFAAIKSGLITNEANTARHTRGSFKSNCESIKELKQLEQLQPNAFYAINTMIAAPELILDISKADNQDKCKALPTEKWVLCHREGF